MKISKTSFYNISIWRLRDVETQYIAFLDKRRLSKDCKEVAQAIAEKEGHSIDDYVIFTIVHQFNRLVIPDRATDDGKNIMMLYHPYFSAIAQNENLVTTKVRFIGWLSKRDVKFLVRYIAGSKGRTK